MVSMSDHFNELKRYSDTIMNDISSVLTKKKIKFTMNPNQTEISILSKNQSKESLMKILTNGLDVPKEAIKSLIYVLDIDGVIFLRLSTK